MSQSAFLGPPAVSLPKEANRKPEKCGVKVARFGRVEESLCGLSWLVGIAGIFLLIGGVGMARFEPHFEVTLSGRAGLGAVDNDSTDMSMAELLAMEEAPEVNPTQEEIQEEVVQVEPIEMTLEMQELQELPELTEALVTEDVFAVPAAPKIAVALTPVDPAKPKPKPQIRQVTEPSRGGRATSPVAMPGGTTGSGGGGGGNGTVGAGGKGKFPKPTYPSGARSRSVSGSLTFRIQISPTGSVESAEVISSNCSNGGFTAAEQSQISAFIRRNWRFPQGMMGTRNLPIRFDLK